MVILDTGEDKVMLSIGGRFNITSRIRERKIFRNFFIMLPPCILFIYNICLEKENDVLGKFNFLKTSFPFLMG